MLYSCRDKCELPFDSYIFYFKNPQPLNDSELNSIPTKFIGEYINSDTKKAKRINGVLVLNEKNAKNWEVRLVNLNKKKLEIKHLYAENDLAKMDSITKIHSKSIDSTTFVINPTRREFSKFLQLKDFGYVQVYEKKSN